MSKQTKPHGPHKTQQEMTFDERADTLAAMVYANAKRIIEVEGQEHAPMLFVLDGESMSIGAIPQFGAGPHIKMAVSAMIEDKLQKREADLIGLVTETWVAARTYDDPSAIGGPGYVRPSEDPNRTEMLMLIVRSLEQERMYRYQISRNPTVLHPYEVDREPTMYAGNLARPNTKPAH